MTPKRFFAASNQIKPPYIILTGREHHHLSRVVRIQTGQRIEVFDERGYAYSALVEHIDSSATRLRILESLPSSQNKLKLILAPALIKAKAMELVIQKSTELGASCIYPLIAQHSVVKYDSNVQKKMSRWKKIILDAAKQSGQTILPEMKQPVTLTDFFASQPKKTGFCLDQEAENLLKQHLHRIPPPKDEVLLMVGPEGDWTEEEKKAIVQHGFHMAGLGRMILRSETAAISGMAIISHFWMS